MNKKKYLFPGNNGFALLSVLIILAILTPLVVNLSYKTRVQMAGADYFASKIKSREIARAGLESAMLALKKDEDKKYDSYKEDWGQFGELSRFSGTFFEEGEFTGKITDEGGKININRLTPDSTTDKQLTSLLKKIEVDTDLLDSVIDWIDSGQDAEIMGAEDNYYSLLENPYFAKDARMDTIYEMRLIKGMSDDIFLGRQDVRGLAEFVTAYGNDRRVNINTAPYEVLLSLSDDMDPAIADDIISYREEESFFEVSDISRVEGITKGGDIYNSLISRIRVKSNYFSINIRGVFRKVSTDIYALVRREGSNVRIVVYSEV